MVLQSVTSTSKHTLALITLLFTANPMNETLTFEDIIEGMASDPEFIKQCEENNRMWDEEAAAHLEVTVDQLHRMLHIGHA